MIRGGPRLRIILADKAGGVAIPHGVSSRAAVRGEAMGMHGRRRLQSFVCLLLCLGVLTSCAGLGDRRGGPGAAKKSPAQEAAEALFNEAERAYREGNY